MAVFVQSAILTHKHLCMFSVRVNTLKVETDTFFSRVSLRFPECSFSRVAWYADAFVLDGISREEFLESEFVKEGFCYLQNLSSMIPAIVLAPQSDERVLDLCAAPGSKTTQLSQLMNNTGMIIANDSSRARLFKLRAILERYGVSNVCLHHGVGQTLWRKRTLSCFSEEFSPLAGFDRVLVDVPCSMDQAYAPKRLRPLVTLQKKLLRSAFLMARVGGIVVYSTCTNEEKENEDVVLWALTKCPNMHLDTFSIEGGEREWQQNKGMLRISKKEPYESFFVAKFVREGE